MPYYEGIVRMRLEVEMGKKSTVMLTRTTSPMKLELPVTEYVRAVALKDGLLTGSSIAIYPSIVNFMTIEFDYRTA